MMQSMAILLMVLVPVSMQEIHYVKPLNVSSSSCPHQPCLTLEQYAESVPTYFIAGSSFVFLPGNHSLKSSISLSNISNITLMGAGRNFTATIICTVQYTLQCENVSNFSIEWLSFDLTKNLLHYSIIAMEISNSKDVTISDCTFKGSGISAKHM